MYLIEIKNIFRRYINTKFEESKLSTVVSLTPENFARTLR